MNPSPALPGRPHRALAALCTVLALLTFVAPAPAAIANETAVLPEQTAVEATTVTLEGDNTVLSYLTPTFSPARPSGTLKYQYLRDGVPIAFPHLGTRSEYRMIPEDFGTRISVRVTVTAEGQEPIVLTSPESAPVLGYLSASAGGIGQPVLNTKIGVSPSAGGWPALTTNPSTSYTWFRDGAPIAGATGWQYTVSEDDLGANITATAELALPGYRSATDSVSFGTAIRGHLVLASEPVITYSSGTPNAAFPGTVLKASSPALQAPAPAGMTYTYQWGRSTGWSSTWMEPIPGATGPSYTVRTEDIAQILRVTVTPVADGYVGIPELSAFNGAPTIQGRFTAPAAPTIKGTALAGQLLTAVPGVAPSPAADSVQYVWYQDGMRLTDQSTDPTYRVTPADGGHQITVKAFYNKANYVQAVSPASAAVTPPGYFTLGAASITGTAAVGYTVRAGTAGVSPAPSTVLYQWLRDGKPITGATASAYRLTTGDQWRQITVRIRLKRAATVDAVLTSRAIKPLAVFTKLPTPVVSGTFAAGHVLRASTAQSYPAAASITWQWQRDGKPIAGATASTYRLTLTDRDKFISVVATYRKLNYLTARRASAIRWVPGPNTV